MYYMEHVSARNVSAGKADQVASAPVPRRPTKIKPGASGTVHLSFMVEAELVRSIDEETERMKAEDPYDRAVSRTDAVRSLLRDGLKNTARNAAPSSTRARGASRRVVSVPSVRQH